jgi:hypothetical protein
VPASSPPETQSHGPRINPRVGMNGLEEQADNAKARDLVWKPLSWLGTLRPSSANDASDPALWETFFTSTTGFEVPVLSSLPRHHNSPLAKCGCKKHAMDFHGDHTSTCTAHSGATKAHDWMVGALAPLFRTAGHTVRTQHGVTASAGQRRGDVELRNYLRDQAGSRSLVFDISITRVFKDTQPPYLHSLPGVESSKVTSTPRKESSKTIISSTAVPKIKTIISSTAVPKQLSRPRQYQT